MNIQKKAQQGFTLIELMIVIAIVGILAAIALPAYQDYIIRSKMSEPLAALAEAKTSVAEYYASNSRVPPDSDRAGILTFPDKDIVVSMGYTSVGGLPLVTAIVRAGIIPTDLAEDSYGISLSGDTVSGNTLKWTCKSTTDGVYSGGNSVVIESKYLPSNCRN